MYNDNGKNSRSNSNLFIAYCFYLTFTLQYAPVEVL